MLVSLGQSYDKLGTNAAAATSDEIEYNYTITNNGLLSLYDISLEDNGLHERGVIITCTDVDSSDVAGVGHGNVTGLAAYSNNKGLAPARSLTCSAIDNVTQEEVRMKVSSVVPDTIGHRAYGKITTRSTLHSSGRGRCHLFVALYLVVLSRGSAAHYATHQVASCGVFFTWTSL